MKAKQVLKSAVGGLLSAALLLPLLCGCGGNTGGTATRTVSALAITHETATAEDCAANDASEQAIAAETLTVEYEANFEPLFDWTAAWAEDASEEWTAQNVTEFVMIAPESDGAATANAACIQAFGAPVIVTATVRQLPDVSVSTTCEFVQRITAATLTSLDDAEEIRLNDPTFLYLALDLELGAGTLPPEIEVRTARFNLSDDFYSALQGTSYLQPYQIIRTVSADFTVSSQIVSGNTLAVQVEIDLPSTFFGNFIYSGYTGDKAAAMKSAHNYVQSYMQSEEPECTLVITFASKYGEKTFSAASVSFGYDFDVEYL